MLGRPQLLDEPYEEEGRRGTSKSEIVGGEGGEGGSCGYIKEEKQDILFH